MGDCMPVLESWDSNRNFNMDFDAYFKQDEKYCIYSNKYLEDGEANKLRISGDDEIILKV